MSTGRVAVVIDYQNIHLTAHDIFCPLGLAKHQSLVHPLHFATQLLAARQVAMAARGPDPQQVELGLVDTYRGLPTNKEEPQQYRRSQAQKSEWTRDRRVTVTYRPLRYYGHGGERVGREKGVDVLVALALCRLVEEASHDVVILAAHDSDLEPALEQAVQSSNVRSGRVKLETTGVAGRKATASREQVAVAHISVR